MSSKKIETREKVMKTAWTLLEQAGTADAVRMSDIAKKAGVSRQAVYLHFPTRADLLIDTARYLDDVLKVDERLVPSRTAQSGLERLDAWIENWGNYIPDIYGVGRAFMAMQDTDEAAAAAWKDRMDAVRHGCAAAIAALVRDGILNPAYTEDTATDMLWTLVSVRAWEHLVRDCGWTQADYISRMQQAARRVLTVADQV